MGSSNPIREDTKLSFGMSGIIGQQMNEEFMLAAHAVMHGKLNGNGSGLTGVDGRRTGNRTGRSAPLQEFKPRFLQNL